ncbi:type II secretion system secretin GspD [Pelagibius sp. CAU 1746]|uniref:type II secretion system secretin GspD n=1 Tax=Pelagibius sp. CAU 1746 TaxID=3140370 RepID=UPI00325A8A23
MTTIRRLSVGLIAASLTIVLTACEASKTSSREFFGETLSQSAKDKTSPSSEEGSAEPLEPEAVASDGGIRPFEVRGSGQLARLPGPRPRGVQVAQVQDTAEGVTMNFVDADLREVIRAVLEDTLDLNYVVDPNVQGRVTLQTSQPLAPEQVLPTLEELLRMNGAALVESDGLFRVLPADQAGVGIANLTYDGPSGRGISTQVIPLRFVSANEVGTVAQSFAANPSSVRIDPARNLLFVTGTRAELTSLNNLVAVLDVDWLSGMSFALEPLEAVTPDTLVAELQQILDDPNGPRLSDIVRFVPIERMNAVLVISKQPRYLDEARRWIDRLDQGSSNAQRVYVYYVQNRRAADLADTLGNIFSAETTTTSLAAEPAVAPGLTPATLTSEPPQPRGFDEAPAPAPPTAGNAPPAAGAAPARGASRGSAARGSALGGSGAIRILADEASNSLVILATPEGYRQVEAALKRLDILPLQVLIEATLMEVTLNDSLEYGVRWFFESGDSSFTFTDAAAEGGAAVLGASFPGFSYVFDSNNIHATLNALKGITDVKFLSAPTLMVLDNETARLQVGDEVPIVTRTSTSTVGDNAPIVNDVELRDTGVILDITPRVNSGGLVVLDVAQEVSEVTETTSSGIDSPTIQQRKMESTIAVQNGETIVLGGLIRNRLEEGTTSVPVLGDIPILGNLFKATDNSSSRTELLVLIKPQVVRNQEDARAVTEELRRKLPGIFPPEPAEGDGDAESGAVETGTPNS